MNASRSRGFTLIELLVAITIIAVASATVVVALRNTGGADLEREALHLASVLETARAEARAASLDVTWQPDQGRFRFTGLPQDLVDRLKLNRGWLGDEPSVTIRGASDNNGRVRLGPEPIIGAQHILLTRGDAHITLGTDGLRPFSIERETAP
ncbi:prepilin-type N-terminal cleavage/methylation domain-containing protein [Roseateles sp. SL47]|uniref:type II secretion system protein n=1 Tax=Roseateles sp. SL47 TaxID=2995138 RepID=UPI00226FAA74|nr:prepilin-type N-terminal cleavage/methylation domain-containing protein [Roseateles sp. SL47]WAC73281.1 prepilin-type N-terminal cleavage/methylation domain-containing protein [Roseateles sp. SL47]